MSSPLTPVTTAPVSTPQNRTVIRTFPKAVASMTSIPTREDYKPMLDANADKKRRKDRVGALSDSREDEDALTCRSLGGALGSDRRRGRQTRPSTSNVVNSGGHPKLKIKFGNSIIGQAVESPLEDRGGAIRPPKKRLSSMPNKPSIEELRRDSMRYRRMVMADFNSSDVKKDKTKSKKDRTGREKKRDKKRDKKRSQEGCVQILEEGTTKLIIRLGKNPSSEEGEGAAQPSSEEAQKRVAPPPDNAPTHRDEQESVRVPVDGGANDDQKEPEKPDAAGATSLKNVRSAKVTPIRLKLTRCQEGYELKERGGASDVATGADPKVPASSESVKRDEAPTEPTNCPPAPLSQDCQVR